ncbi:hypothetical protein D9756_002719 [Leucocoprinus leucothites]|uniref:Uncharacterized protein n=1 Tax=Leucocoprinus leucothites TaxID=201217 RepID=A0A8H5GCP7_9AGAR|nr:hypothetical protein D9756_002719 [Leucoagaricus leucothites]
MMSDLEVCKCDCNGIHPVLPIDGRHKTRTFYVYHVVASGSNVVLPEINSSRASDNCLLIPTAQTTAMQFKALIWCTLAFVIPQITATEIDPIQMICKVPADFSQVRADIRFGQIMKSSTAASNGPTPGDIAAAVPS